MQLRTTREQATALWNKVLESTGQPLVRDRLARIVREYRVPARDPEALAAAVQAWIQGNVKYFREEPETYATGPRTLEWGLGDCDDQAILLCSLLRSARCPCRLAIVGWAEPGTPAARIPFKHVYGQAWTGDRWQSAETVRPVPLGFDTHAYQIIGKGQVGKVLTVGDRPNQWT